MHYKNGRPAQNGDKVVLLASWGAPVIGILYDAQAGNDYCNGKIAPVSPNDPMPNLQECLHLDDVLAALPATVPDSTVSVAPADPGALARTAYAAYGATTDYKNFRGDPMPEFDDLPEAIRNAWDAAARAVAAQ